jgi:hypothetical protein
MGGQVEQGMMNVEGNDIINNTPVTINAFIKEYRADFLWEKRTSPVRETSRLYNRG